MTAAPDRVKVFSSTAGTGTSVVLGARTHEFFMTPAEAGMLDGYAYDYIIEQGSDWEHQERQVYTASGTTIARGTPKRSRIGGAALGTTKLTLDGTEVVYFPVIESIWGQIAVGCCQLVFVSATQLRLDRIDGQTLVINGLPRIIPTAGVTVSNGGLSANTTYYVYAYMSGGTMTLEIVVTVSAIDSVTGVEIKSGDATRTLVGMVRTNASTQFADSGANRLVASYFNRRAKVGRGLILASRTITTTSYAAVTDCLVNFVAWADEVVTLKGLGGGYIASGSVQFLATTSLDSTTVGQEGAVAWAPTSLLTGIGAAGWSGLVSEGFHAARLLARVSSAGTANLDFASGDPGNAGIQVVTNA